MSSLMNEAKTQILLNKYEGMLRNCAYMMA